MTRIILLTITLLTFAISKGTIAGSTIDNIATIEYKLPNSTIKLQSNVDSFVVDQVVDIKLGWQDSSEIAVASGEKNRVLTFEVANFGNREDSINLEHISSGNNNFNSKPNNVRIFKDNNGNGIWDSSDSEIDQIILNEDANATLFLVSDIQEDSYTPNDKDDEGIKATSKSIASSGADRANDVDVVIRDKSAQDYGIYMIRDYWLESIKSATIDSEDNKTHTGSIITYKITLKIAGDSSNEEISNIKLKDAIPTGTTYVDGSLKLNGVSLSDAKDADAGYFENNNIYTSISKIVDNQTKELLFKVKVK